MSEVSRVAAAAVALEGAFVNPLPTTRAPEAINTAALEGTEDRATVGDAADEEIAAVEASTKIVAMEHAVTKQAPTGEAVTKAVEDVTVAAGG